jgi:hypothetical protein
MMASGAYYWIVTHGTVVAAILGRHEAWRYTLMSGSFRRSR